jgi:hypothetical protein
MLVSCRFISNNVCYAYQVSHHNYLCCRSAPLVFVKMLQVTSALKLSVAVALLTLLKTI